jgi:hypothetical protein
VEYLKIWIIRSAISLLVFILLALFLFAILPSAPSADYGLGEAASSTENITLPTNVVEVTVTAIPAYTADPDKDWPEPSPIFDPVHVANLAVLLLVFWALWFSTGRSQKPVYA